MKKIIADILFYTGISYLLFRIRLLSTGIRVINYHCTPASSRRQLEKQLRFYKKYFDNISLKELGDFFNGFPSNRGKRPGLIISFDDGLRSNFDNAVGLLEQYGFTGWFFIPTGFLLNPTRNFVVDNSILIKQEYNDNRYGMSLDEARSVSLSHVIGCHTFTHHRMAVSDSFATLKYEILEAKLQLEKLLELKEVCCFCWVGGELNTYTVEAYKMINESGFKYSFSTNSLPVNTRDPYRINRTNIEAEYSMAMVMFQLSGLMDMLYYNKRKQVIKATSACF